MGFLWCEYQPSFVQPVAEDVFHRFGIFLALTEHTKVIRIPYQCSLTVQFASFSMLDLKSFFHAMQRDIGEEGANHAPYNVANFGHLFLREAVACGEED